MIETAAEPLYDSIRYKLRSIASGVVSGPCLNMLCTDGMNHTLRSWRQLNRRLIAEAEGAQVSDQRTFEAKGMEAAAEAGFKWGWQRGC